METPTNINAGQSLIGGAWSKSSADDLASMGFEYEAADAVGDIWFRYGVAVDPSARDTEEPGEDEPQYLWQSRSQGCMVLFSPTSEGMLPVASYDITRPEVPVVLA